MNKLETMGIMAVLKEAYPMYYKDKSKEELSATVNLWSEMFADDDVNLVKAAVKSYLANDIKGFPPVIGQIKNSLQKLLQPKILSEVEAWGLVSKALTNGYYNAKEEFEKLPQTIQNTIGSADRLREWSQVDAQTVQTVISSNFMRSYKAKSRHEQEYAKLPNDIKQLINKTILQIEDKKESAINE